MVTLFQDSTVSLPLGFRCWPTCESGSLLLTGFTFNAAAIKAPYLIAVRWEGDLLYVRTLWDPSGSRMPEYEHSALQLLPDTTAAARPQ